MVNFRALVCDFACHPDQSQFVSVYESSVKEGEEYMKHGEMFLSEVRVRWFGRGRARNLSIDKGAWWILRGIHSSQINFSYQLCNLR